jgi:hypothetical protein
MSSVGTAGIFWAIPEIGDGQASGPPNTVTNWYEFEAATPELNSGDNTIVTNMVGLHVESLASAGTTNVYGVDVENQGSANYALKTGTGQVSFGGPVTIGPIKGNSATGSTLTGTGACATNSTPVTAGPVGDTTCTGSTGAATLIITPAAVSGSTPSTTYVCGGSDTTTVAAGAQQGTSTTTCTLKFTVVSTNDIITFWVYAL